ncbi:hypothetical protein ACN47E_000036 [Coniothyrium glycines]
MHDQPRGLVRTIHKRNRGRSQGSILTAANARGCPSVRDTANARGATAVRGRSTRSRPHKFRVGSSSFPVPNHGVNSIPIRPRQSHFAETLPSLCTEATRLDNDQKQVGQEQTQPTDLFGDYNPYSLFDQDDANPPDIPSCSPDDSDYIMRTARAFDLVLNYLRDNPDGRRWTAADIDTIRHEGRHLHENICALSRRAPEETLPLDVDCLLRYCQDVQDSIRRLESQYLPIDQQGNIYAKDGNVYNKEGHLIGEWGELVDKVA